MHVIKNIKTMNEEIQNDGEIQIISLKDEDGNDRDFEIIDELDYEGVHYCALLPYYEDVEELDAKSEDDDTEILIMSLMPEENGDEYCEMIEDDDLFEKVTAMIDERISKMYDDEENNPEPLLGE